MITREELYHILTNPILATIWLILGIVVKKVIEAMLPDKKIINSYTKNALSFAYWYVFPVCMVIILMAVAKFDKWLVLGICIYVNGALFNMLMKLIADHIGLTKRLINTVEESKEAHATIVDGMNMFQTTTMHIAKEIERLENSKKNRKKPKEA